MHAIQVSELGGPEVLRWVEVDDPGPGPGQLLVQLHTAGLNYIDTYLRTGLYPSELPFVPGFEGCGEVVEVGPGVDGVDLGDRVAWALSIGSYAQRVVVPAGKAVRVPDGVSSEAATTLMIQGMTAHYLACDTYPLQPGDRCLVHAGAGGVGQLLIQIAKLRGAEVFTTVGSEAKAALAREVGADHVILYREVDFGDAVEAIAGPRPLDVVYDGVGAATFERGLDLLRPRGTMATFGNASGPVPPVSPLALSRGGSLFLTRPTLFDYVRERHELEARAADLFRWHTEGRLQTRIGDRLPLSDAAEAHRALEARATTGKVLLIP